MPRARPLLLASALIAGVACASDEERRGAPAGPVLVEVTNHNVLDVTVFAVGGGQTSRLGTVPTNATQTFEVSRALNLVSGLRLLVDPVGSVEAANSAGFIWMFPLTFVSSAFVDPDQMEGWLQPIARNNPFSVLTNACRALYNGYDPGSDLWVATAWALGITIVFAVLASRKFARSTST